MKGVLQILRFNWPWYGAAGVVLLLVYGALPAVGLTPIGRRIVIALTLPAMIWAVASVLVSHWVYDRSPLGQWDWIAECVTPPPVEAANIHAGFDETSSALRRIFPRMRMAVWDVYQPKTMSEGSIVRARRIQRRKRARTQPLGLPAISVLLGARGALRTARPTSCAPEEVDFRRLPEADEGLDAVFLIFAAHEIRSASAREELFGEVHRILKPGGTVLLVEHLRDWRNFLAYGPGFLHFLPRGEWLRLADKAGFQVAREFRITPFVDVLLLTKPRAI